MKICTKCKVEKPLTEFGKSSYSKDKLRHQCKSCRKLYRLLNKEKIALKDKEYYLSTRNVRLAKVKIYRDKNPEVIKLWREKNKEKIAGWEKAYRPSYLKNNKAKIREWDKNYRKNNQAKVREWRKNYVKLNRGKIRLRLQNYQQKKKDNNFIKTELQKFVAQEMYDLAQIRKAETGIDWHVDHIEPISKGGKHAINNLQVVPAVWNLSKGNRNNNIFKIGEI